jgi:hypothetical protein
MNRILSSPFVKYSGTCILDQVATINGSLPTARTLWCLLLISLYRAMVDTKTLQPSSRAICRIWIITSPMPGISWQREIWVLSRDAKVSIWIISLLSISTNRLGPFVPPAQPFQNPLPASMPAVDVTPIKRQLVRVYPRYFTLFLVFTSRPCIQTLRCLRIACLAAVLTTAPTSSRWLGRYVLKRFIIVTQT